MEITSGFDKIASVYDWMARIVFGKSIQQAQVYFLGDVPSQSKVLILGGGTGWFLQYLLLLKPDCEVWYIEASKKMLELSKIKTSHSSNVHFIQGTEHDIPLGIQFDAVITNFYLDLFTEMSLDATLSRIETVLKSGSIWLATDFVDGKKVWQSVLLKVMYFFFRLTCRIIATKLPSWNQQLAKTNAIKSKSKFFFGEFIEATVYQVK